MLTFAGGATVENYDDAGTKPIVVETKTLSGSAVIEISAFVNNGDHDINIDQSVTVTILSGPVTAMSLVYGHTLPDDGSGILYNSYTIHAVDRYNNPAREGIVLHPSLINGTKVIKTALIDAVGSINASTPVSFTDITNPFGLVDDGVDLLAIVSNPDKTDQLYLGNWTIDGATAGSLTLAEAYQGAITANLNYVIGNSDRYISQYGIATVDISSPTGLFVTNANGTTEFIVGFDRILAGHTITLSANAVDGNRTGISKIAGLRWDDYSSSSKKIQNDGLNHVITLQLGISSGIEHLVGLSIDPDSIVSSDATCALDVSGANILTTNSNGVIQVELATRLTVSAATECTISWNMSPGSIYREY